ncbi:MAG TPA: Asp-tRNA(Asn)/Glu-tRNA(Gln) amidotransferase subunit GatC [Candidatus Gracilibacteria bacterium]|nr:Asp-tRNA(Asn)/Glu-tRNA(Gln) amidotransferase subunit GatC [Candidatus Gracilibacteria bacterium]
MLDLALIRKIAQLSRLHLSSEEEIQYQKDLSQIFASFENLNKVDTDGVEPLFQVGDGENTGRIDQIQDTSLAEELLTNVPNPILHHQIVVPAVLNDDK